jgi:hypothetical protein
MFEITADDIARLNDEQLRMLIALLCEAEMRARKYSTAAVTWGGDQNAVDGGADVRVSLPLDKPIDGYVPRGATVFQVKKQDMPPAEIAGEMRPGGVIRPIIQELANISGAYVIVSSEGSTSDAALRRRRDAMAEAVKGAGNANQLALDFYDRTRIASWVRGHAGLILWVRSTIGRAIPGWEPFGAWAYPKEGLQAEYFLDDGIRIRQRPATTGGDLATTDGLNLIREILAQPRSVVRLVGLSGVGKTRFVQALFDERIGNNSLDPSLAIYTNMNSGPDPQPTVMTSDLNAQNMRAILIVDNCASELHSRLSEIVTRPSSNLSALTVEYDIRDDQPEGTSVFEVQVASTALIEKLLRTRYLRISEIDARTAAEFSGGNARIAIALADTVAQSGTLDRLTDDQLFQRLFVQRQDQDKSLLEIAQVCSLVYSLNGEDTTDGPEAELTRLARIIGKTADEVYKGVAELLRRDLAQRRGIWRAVLPHAIANRLAATALQNIPYTRIAGGLVNGASERLAVSFSKRLGYLHANPEAATIVANWFERGGWISDVWNLNDFGKALFKNVLPANPNAGLAAIELGVPRPDELSQKSGLDYLPRALRSLAYDAALFDRCTTMLQMVVRFGSPGIVKEAADIHTSLFYIYLSGTHATIEQRVAAAKKLLLSEVASLRALGISALNALLQTSHFTSHYDFQFGAHSRDYGYMPQTAVAISRWFRGAFSLAEEVALSNGPAAEAVTSQIAEDFRGLWTNAGLNAELEAFSAKIVAKGFWKEGWHAVKQTRHYDEQDNTSENYVRLSKLEELLRPQSLIEKVRGRVLTPKRGGYYDVDDIDPSSPDGYHNAMEKKTAEAEKLGIEIALDQDVLKELLPELLLSRVNMWSFGVGLAKGAKDPKAVWQIFLEAFGSAQTGPRDFGLLCGMLSQWNTTDPQLVSNLLDEALDNPPLAAFFPIIQSAVKLDDLGIQRLFISLELGHVQTHLYQNLALGRTTDQIPPADLARFILALSQAADGLKVALHIMSMQFFSDKSGKKAHAPELKAAGRQLLSRYKFVERDQQEEFDLDQIVEACLLGNDGYDTAILLCKNLILAVTNLVVSGFQFSQLLRALFRVQPLAVLNEFFAGDATALKVGTRVLEEVSYLQPNPMEQVPGETLVAWCAQDGEKRFPAIASSAPVFQMSADRNPIGWAPLAYALVRNSPDPVAVMRAYAARLRPTSWSGSRAVILEANTKLLREWDAAGDIALKAFLDSAEAELTAEARAEREWENKRNSARDERFEY